MCKVDKSFINALCVHQQASVERKKKNCTGRLSAPQQLCTYSIFSLKDQITDTEWRRNPYSTKTLCPSLWGSDTFAPVL